MIECQVDLMMMQVCHSIRSHQSFPAFEAHVECVGYSMACQSCCHSRNCAFQTDDAAGEKASEMSKAVVILTCPAAMFSRAFRIWLVVKM